MVKLLGELFLTGNMNIKRMSQPQTTIYEHIKVKDNHIEVVGEHAMSGVAPLRLFQGLFGADEMLTNYRSSLDTWIATLILTGANIEEVHYKKKQTYINIRNREYNQ